MNYADTISFDCGAADQSLIREFVRQAKAIFARGGPIDKIYQRISLLPTEFAKTAQEVVLGMPADETGFLLDPAHPHQRFANRKEMLAAIFRRKLAAD